MSIYRFTILKSKFNNINNPINYLNIKLIILNLNYLKFNSSIIFIIF